jgi:predicted  nucleic acid-binding Zn-ribbon protein
MKIDKSMLILAFFLGCSVPSFAGDICSTKPEAESVKNPLPVKYQKLKAQNEELKRKLEDCKAEKERVKEEISRLNEEISTLESTEARLKKELSQLPSKESLEEQIRKLENEEGR